MPRTPIYSATRRTLQALALPAALGAVILGLFGCAHAMIEGTQVQDTEDNRAVLQTLQAARVAMEGRDADALLALVSHEYSEDMGTANPDDDYGYVELEADILPNTMKVTDEFRVGFTVHEVVVDGDMARADIRYRSRIKITVPAGVARDNRQEFNRVELVREGGTWLITSGL